MRSVLLAFLIVSGLSAPGIAQSPRETETRQEGPAATLALPSREERLKSLFATLKSADKDAAKAAKTRSSRCGSRPAAIRSIS